MAGALPDLTARVRLDTSDLEGGVKRGAAFGSALGSAFGSLAAGGIGAALGKVREFAGGAVDAFAAVEDATGAAGVQFGSALPTVLSFADKASASFGLSKRAALDAQNSFGTLGKAAGLSGEPLAAFSGKLTGLAGDLASFKGTSTEQAIEAVGAALRGETEPIRAYGVLLDDATLRAEAVTLGLIKTVKDGLTPQQKALAAQSAILKQTTDAQGDYARTSDSTANTQKTLAAETENAQAVLGEKLAPAVTAVRGGLLALIKGLTGVIDTLTPFFRTVSLGVSAFVAALREGDVTSDGFVGQMETLGDALHRALPVIRDMAVRVVELVRGFAAFVAGLPTPVLQALGIVLGAVAAAIVVQTAATAAASLATGAWAAITGPFVAVKNAEGAVIARGTVLRLAHNVATVASTVATTAWAVATKAAAVSMRVLNAVMKANPFVLVVSLIIGLVAAFVTAYKTSDTFRAKVDGAFRAVQQVVTSVLTAVGAFIRSTWAAISSTFTSALAAIRAAITAAFTAYKVVVTTILGAIRGAIVAVWEGIKAVFTGALTVIRTVITTYFNAYRTVVTTVLGAIRTVITTVLQAVSAVFTAVLGAVSALITRSVNGWRTIITTVLGAVRGVVTTVLGAIKGVFGSVFGAISGVVSGALNAVKGAVSGALGAIRGAISSGLSTVAGLFGGAFRAAAGAVSGAIGSITGAVRGIPGAIKGALGNLSGLLTGAGGQVISGLVSGIRNAIGGAARAAAEAAKAVLGAAKRALGISSPSKVFRDQVGLPVVQGLAQGIGRNAGLARRAMDDLVQVPDISAGVGAATGAALRGRRPGAGSGAGALAGGATYHLELHGVDLSRDPGDVTVTALRRMELLTP